jgi:DNA uptake protein ComE-like DNA-binding protein
MLLSLLIMFLLAGRIMVPIITEKPVPDFRDADTAFLAFRSALQSADKAGRSEHAFPVGNKDSIYQYRRPIRYFLFDPNQISYTELLELGLSARVAGTLINYRKSGGKFKCKQDLMKVYGLGAVEFERLEPYVCIKPAAQPVEKKRELVLLELNSSDSLQLQEVSGIGPVFARRIIRYRDLLGGYCSREQLKEVYGLGDRQYEEIIGQVMIDTSRLRRMDLNSVERGTLSRHPYLTSYQADALMTYREYKGQWKDIGEIMQQQLLPDSVFRRIRPYLMVGE